MTQIDIEIFETILECPKCKHRVPLTTQIREVLRQIDDKKKKKKKDVA